LEHTDKAWTRSQSKRDPSGGKLSHQFGSILPLFSSMNWRKIFSMLEKAHNHLF